MIKQRRVKDKYVHKERNRFGTVCYYYREKNGPRVRLPSEFGTDRFWLEVERIRSDYAQGIFSPSERPKRERFMRLLEMSLRAGVERAQRKAGSECDLDFGWAMAQAERQGFRCALSGVPFFSKASKSRLHHPFAPSFDRIAAGGPYTRENVRIVTFAMNVMLFDWGTEVFQKTAAGFMRRANKR